ncbi:MAG: winged helix-turn-helix transcriptional regulator [Actinomycetota bacterium]
MGTIKPGPAPAKQCPLTAALELLGRAWMLETIRELLAGPRHFVELRHATGCPSPSTFTRRLRVLEAEGLVAREVISLTPPSVRYELTEMGLGLTSALTEVSRWAERWLVPVDANEQGSDRPRVGVANPLVLESA